jgi:hypothetical protein
MVARRFLAVSAACWTLSVCGGAFAEPVGQSPAVQGDERSEPRLHHPPIASARSGETLVLEANIEHPQLVKRALAIYQVGADAKLREVEFRRGIHGYVAELPAQAMRSPWIAYAIELELLDGTRREVFASRKSPHMVEVPEDRTDARERILYDRLERRRSVASATAEYVSFGESEARVLNVETQRFEPARIPDSYYRIEGAYTYRPMRFVTQFSLRIGTVRGRSPVPLEDDEVAEDGSDRLSVGLDYGAPTVLVHLHDLIHLEGELLVGLTEVRVAGGAGGALLIGDPFGTRLTLGFEAIEVFGNRFYSRLDVRASDRITLAPMVEATNMPHANKYGVRLLGEVGVDVGAGFRVAARGGYQARLATEGGPTLGATLAYAF